MLCFTRHLDPWILQEPRGLSPLLLANPEVSPVGPQGPVFDQRERLRHLVIGSPTGVRSVIHTLHKLNYADQSHWSQLIAIPKSGILITPDQGEVLSLLRRDRQRLEP